MTSALVTECISKAGELTVLLYSGPLYGVLVLSGEDSLSLAVNAKSTKTTLFNTSSACQVF